jgi:hypothetical protein
LQDDFLSLISPLALIATVIKCTNDGLISLINLSRGLSTEYVIYFLISIQKLHDQPRSTSDVTRTKL